jgi:hypothetical protein
LVRIIKTHLKSNNSYNFGNANEVNEELSNYEVWKAATWKFSFEGIVQLIVDFATVPVHWDKGFGGIQQMCIKLCVNWQSCKTWINCFP